MVMREMMDLVDKGVVSMEDCETALTFGPAIRWAIMGPGQIFELGGGEHGLQGLFLMICLGIYTVLIRTVQITDINASLFSILGYALLLGLMMFKSGTVAKSIMNTH